MPVDEIFQFIGGQGAFVAAQVDLGQSQLWMREMRGIEAFGGFEILLGQLQAVYREVSHSQLRVRQGVIRPAEHGI